MISFYTLLCYSLYVHKVEYGKWSLVSLHNNPEILFDDLTLVKILSMIVAKVIILVGLFIVTSHSYTANLDILLYLYDFLA